MIFIKYPTESVNLTTLNECPQNQNECINILKFELIIVLKNTWCTFLIFYSQFSSGGQIWDPASLHSKRGTLPSVYDLISPSTYLLCRRQFAWEQRSQKLKTVCHFLSSLCSRQHGAGEWGEKCKLTRRRKEKHLRCPMKSTVFTAST